MIYSLMDSSHRITDMTISVVDIQILLMTVQYNNYPTLNFRKRIATACDD